MPHQQDAAPGPGRGAARLDAPLHPAVAPRWRQHARPRPLPAGAGGAHRCPGLARPVAAAPPAGPAGTAAAGAAGDAGPPRDQSLGGPHAGRHAAPAFAVRHHLPAPCAAPQRQLPAVAPVGGRAGAGLPCWACRRSHPGANATACALHRCGPGHAGGRHRCPDRRRRLGGPGRRTDAGAADHVAWPGHPVPRPADRRRRAAALAGRAGRGPVHAGPAAGPGGQPAAVHRALRQRHGHRAVAGRLGLPAAPRA